MTLMYVDGFSSSPCNIRIPFLCPSGRMIGFLGAHRTWAKIAEGDTVDVAKESMGVKSYLGRIECNIEFQKKSFKTKER